MANLRRLGFELNSSTADVEWTTQSGAGATIQSAVVRSGAYAGKIAITASPAEGWEYQFAAAAANGPYFFRFYLRLTGLPASDTTLLMLASTGGFNGNTICTVNVDNTGLIGVTTGGTNTRVGTAGPTLTTDVWYRVEAKFDASPASGSRVWTGRVDGGTDFGVTNGTFTGVLAANFGHGMNGEANASGTWYYDDIAINDSTGTGQTTYAGAGSLIVLRPATTGDSNSFATQTGGTAGSAFNFSRVNEITPDDAATLNGSNVLSQEDLFRCQQVYGSGTVNVVEVNCRFRNNVADATTAAKLEIRGASGGTKTQSAALIPNSTTFFTNATALPRPALLNLYTDPDSVAWTVKSIDNLQIGYIISTGGTNRIEFSTIWAYVEFTEPSTIKLPVGFRAALRPSSYSPWIAR